MIGFILPVRPLLLFGLAFTSWGAEAFEDIAIMKRGVYTFAWENDAFGGNSFDSDRYYTNGLKLTWVSPTLRSGNLKNDGTRELFGWVSQFNDLLVGGAVGDTDQDVKRNIVLGIGQAIYTPRGSLRHVRALIKEDRPYAGWLYLTYGLNARIDNTDATKSVGDALHSLEINLGVVGPSSRAQQLQTWWHRSVLDIEAFRGWDNQLKNEPGFQAAYERKYRPRWARDETGAFEYDAIAHWGASVGNVQTYANTGVEIRFGTTVPDDFGTSPIRPGGNSSAPLGEARAARSSSSRIESGVHAYLAANAKAVVRDIFLDGNSFRDSHSVEKRRFVGDAAVGLVIRYKKVSLHLSRVERSREFISQVGKQKFASALLSVEI